MTTKKTHQTAVATPETAAISAITVSAPPSLSSVQKAPETFVAPDGSPYNGIFPRATELTALPQAITDVSAFVNYAATLGGTVPAQPDLVSAMTLAFQWSTVRNAATNWERYCMNEEGMAWTHLRALLGQVKPAFDWAVKSNTQLPTKYKGFAALLTVHKAIARKGIATKQANKKEEEKGNPPTHGAVGKRRERAAAKAALEAARKNGSAPEGQDGSTGATSATAATDATTTPGAAKS